MKKLLSKSISINFGGYIVSREFHFLPSLSIYFCDGMFTIAGLRTVFGFRIEFTRPQKQNSEEICSFTSKKL